MTRADWQTAAEHELLRQRAIVYRYIRDFFHRRNVVEVETPVLSRAGNTDPNIASFALEFNGHNDAGPAKRWLRTSPEFPLKRLLAGGFGDCYELGKVFRNGEYGTRHNPEFTMLEWYRVGWDHLRLAQEAVSLVQGVYALFDKTLHVEQHTYGSLFKTALALDPHTASLFELQNAVAAVASIGTDDLSRDDLLDILLTHGVEPKLPASQLTVIHDFPASQCALAKVRNDPIPVAERFELYVGGIELANGYHELNDAVEQRRRFSADLAVRTQRGMATPELDEHLLQAVAELPDCAGVALGVDRLLMSVLEVSSLRKIIAFDFSAA